MKWEAFLEAADADGLVAPPKLADPVEAASSARQIARWVSNGRLTRLRRGLYVVNTPYRARVPHPLRITGRLLEPSYVSLRAALAFRGVSATPSRVVSSVTSRRTASFETPLGRFAFHVVKPALYGGYEEVDLPDGQVARVATAEKALLDLCYLEPPGSLSRTLAELDLRRSPALSWGRVVAMIDELGNARLSREIRGL